MEQHETEEEKQAYAAGMRDTFTLALLLCFVWLACGCAPADHYLDVDTGKNTPTGADLLWVLDAPEVYAINGAQVSAPFAVPQDCGTLPTPFTSLDADLADAWYCVLTDQQARRSIQVLDLDDAGDLQISIPGLQP